MFEVHVHDHGRPLVTRGPAAGCRDFPRHKWTRITTRPLGIARAVALANEQDRHAVVCEWMTSTTVHDNGKAPALPSGWRPEGASPTATQGV